ncbi:MAG: hypothetical protein C4K58_07055 [Flavobacteriaceae bacterium]|nr:MAG: hypothetical protein C4K58_07055 [Flavobacteriaceae bacterium]
MGLFDIFKKKTEIENPNDKKLEIYADKINFKLLFKEKPILNSSEILKEVKKYYNVVDNLTDDENVKIYAFPDLKIELADAVIPAQCLMTLLDKNIELPENAFQQNWHWNEANETAKNCNYQLLVTDFMSIPLAYKDRTELIMSFLLAVTKSTNPDAIYSESGQKIIKPADLIKNWDCDEKQFLYGLSNVRLYNIGDSEKKEVLMDTVGLNYIGLPDFQIVFSNYDVNQIANFLTTYSYYIYENGDVIKSGNTIDGLKPNSMWKIDRQLSAIDGQSVVLNVRTE